MFQIEPRVPVRLLLDVSRSMQTGAAPKFDYARRLAAAIAYVGLVRLDSICIQPFAEGLLDPMLCGGGRHRFAPVADFLTRLEPGKATNFLQATREFAGRYPQRGLLIVISDFLDEHDPRRPLEYLAELGHELLLVHVWAAEDREPPWDGQLQFIDAETEQTVDMAFDEETRHLHASAFDEFARDLQHLALTKSGRYASLPTGVPIEDAIFGPLAASGAVQ
jgi:uncharacterized protein (DUF58 family)